MTEHLDMDHPPDDLPDSLCYCGTCQEAFDIAIRNTRLGLEAGQCAAWLLQVAFTQEMLARAFAAHGTFDGDIAASEAAFHETITTMVHHMARRPNVEAFRALFKDVVERNR